MFIILVDAKKLDEHTLMIVMNRVVYTSKLVLAGDPAQSDSEGHFRGTDLSEFLRVATRTKPPLVIVVSSFRKIVPDRHSSSPCFGSTR